MKVLVWGCGHMASAIARGWKASNPKTEFICWNPTPIKAQELARELGGQVLSSEERIVADAVLLGFKPQLLTTAAPALAQKLPANITVISMLAAVSLARLGEFFAGKKIVRLMPNLAVARGAGVTLWECNQAATSEAASWQHIWSGLGLAPRVNEKLMDVYTLHAGSSPAFLYAWIDAAAEFAEQNGGDAKLARELLIRSWQGALQGLENETLSMKDKIKAVASKGGVTQATLDRWQEISPNYIQEGLAAGLKRIGEMKF